MTQELINWFNVMVKSTDAVAHPDRLDNMITALLAGAVTEHLENGQRSYRPNEQGEYEVRLFDISSIGYLAQCLEITAFEISRVILMPDGIQLK
ncbi:hypothetical protein A3A66_01755 [Microgenomates group bacterium RIFCSPLOWO2_01_FULL_46_13]|nr:MAG: hypothetical protein A3A66_01755 [Microgenomates group bacterium RIFCSPLOWO2_01_FULL_46_13]